MVPAIVMSALDPYKTSSTTALVTMSVSPGVVMVRAPKVIPYFPLLSLDLKTGDIDPFPGFRTEKS